MHAPKLHVHVEGSQTWLGAVPRPVPLVLPSMFITVPWHTKHIEVKGGVASKVPLEGGGRHTFRMLQCAERDAQAL
jgi:hypothetical protein